MIVELEKALLELASVSEDWLADPCLLNVERLKTAVKKVRAVRRSNRSLIARLEDVQVYFNDLRNEAYQLQKAASSAAGLTASECQQLLDWEAEMDAARESK